jgi:anti-sigma B factor antagonist
MLVQEREEGGTHVLRISGRLDAATVAEVDAKLTAASALNRPLVVDLADLAYISSIGLRVLIQTAKRAQTAKVGFAVAAPQPSVKEVFRITGLDTILTVYADLADALGKTR